MSINSWGSRIFLISFISILILTLFGCLYTYAQEPPRILVVIGGDGVVQVYITIYGDQSRDEIISIDLPVKPLPGSINVSPPEVIPQMLPNDSLAILKPAGVSRIDVGYIGYINASAGILSTYIRYPAWAGNVSVRIHRNVIPITIPENISGFRIFGDYIIIDLQRNTTWNLEYILAPQRETATQAQPGIQRETRAQEGQTPIQVLLTMGIIAVAIAGGGTASYLLLRQRRRKTVSEYLDSTDREIIKAIEKLGEATAKDIMDITNLPKTTLYRRLNKLADLGIIGAKAKSGVTYYYIIRKPDY